MDEKWIQESKPWKLLNTQEQMIKPDISGHNERVISEKNMTWTKNMTFQNIRLIGTKVRQKKKNTNVIQVYYVPLIINPLELSVRDSDQI